MVDTFTSRLRLRKPEQGANTDAWAALLNAGLIDLLDDAISARVDIDVTAGDHTLTIANGTDDEARAMFLRVIGTPGTPREIEAPAGVTKMYIVENDSDDDVFVTVSSPQGVTISPGGIAIVYVDASDAVQEIDVSTAFAIVTQPSAMQTLTLDINGSGGGDTTTAAHYVVQGAYAYVNIDGFDSEDFAAGEMSLLPSGGNWPGAIIPASQKIFHVHLLEDTGGGFEVVPAVIEIQSTDDPWVIRPVGGGDFTTGSDRRVDHSMTLVYPLKEPAGTVIEDTQTELTLEVDSNQTTVFDIEAALVAKYGFGSAAWNRTTLTLGVGVHMSPALTSEFAIDGVNMDPASFLTVVYSSMSAAGGKGGQGGRGWSDLTGDPSTNGQDGGAAVRLGCDAEFFGSGSVINGFGGGGGGGDIHINFGTEFELAGGGGGGGAAFGEGGEAGEADLDNGVSTGVPSQDGEAATFFNGGEGGTGEESAGALNDVAEGGRGGGALGAAENGLGSESAFAGSPGKAVELNGFSLETGSFTGTITGTVS